MYVSPNGVSADALTAGAAMLSRPAEEYENDTNVETAWVVQACNFADVHYNLICSADPKLLRLTAFDDRIYNDFVKTFPNLDCRVISEESLKNPAAKQAWRTYLEAHKDIPDYNFGTLLRLDSEQDYNEANTTLVPRLQFLALEIARNRRGDNDKVFKQHSLKQSVEDNSEKSS